MNSLDRITDDVGPRPTIPESIAKVFRNIAGEVRDAAGNAEASQALASLLEQHADGLSGHVLANTPPIAGPSDAPDDTGATGAAEPVEGATGGQHDEGGAGDTPPAGDTGTSDTADKSDKPDA